MITTRTARQCGQADYGWLQARYTFSFGHYFDPKLLGYASLRVLNQEVLAPGAAFQPRTYPKVDILNVILDGEAEYRDSEGNHVQASSGEALLLSTQPGVSYSEHNLSKDKPDGVCQYQHQKNRDQSAKTCADREEQHPGADCRTKQA